MFHTLHCLNKLRMKLHPEYYTAANSHSHSHDDHGEHLDKRASGSDNLLHDGEFTLKLYFIRYCILAIEDENLTTHFQDTASTS